jgi:hypothetical protein
MLKKIIILIFLIKQKLILSSSENFPVSNHKNNFSLNIYHISYCIFSLCIPYILYTFFNIIKKKYNMRYIDNIKKDKNRYEAMN